MAPSPIAATAAETSVVVTADGAAQPGPYDVWVRIGDAAVFVPLQVEQ